MPVRDTLRDYGRRGRHKGAQRRAAKAGMQPNYQPFPAFAAFRVHPFLWRPLRPCRARRRAHHAARFPLIPRGDCLRPHAGVGERLPASPVLSASRGGWLLGGRVIVP